MVQIGSNPVSQFPCGKVWLLSPSPSYVTYSLVVFGFMGSDALSYLRPEVVEYSLIVLNYGKVSTPLVSPLSACHIN